MLALQGCTPTAGPSAGDPGNHRLSQLAADPVFKALPQSAVAEGRAVLTPARYTTPGFQPAGWDGPSVSRTFTSARSPSSVFAYFAERAALAGWRPGNRNTLGYPQTWTKTYPGGVPGTLSLLRVSLARADVPVRYILTASCPAASA